MKHDPKLIKSWESFTGLIWAEDYQGGFSLSFRDFKAGWDACKKNWPSACGGEWYAGEWCKECHAECSLDGGKK